LAEFGIAIKVFNGMVVCVGDGVGRADIGTGKTGDAIICMLDDTKTLFPVQFEHPGRTDIHA